jgi:hypothetical protein
VAQAGDAAERERRGQRALEFALQRFDPRQGVARLADWLEQAAADHASGSRQKAQAG